MHIPVPMHVSGRVVAASATSALLIMACAQSSAPAPVDAGPQAAVAGAAVDAGPPPPIVKLLPPTPPLEKAAADGCQPFWDEVDLKCNEPAIRAHFGAPAGPLRTCDPVHERATRSVVAVILGHPADPSDPMVWEYLRGAAWNDDPEGLLFSSKDGPGSFASNVDWCTRFSAAQIKALHGDSPGVAAPLNARSQFGDLQFLHGLATRPGEKAIDTYNKLIVWLEVTYRIASGEIPGDTVISKVPVSRIREWFPKEAKLTVAQLLGIHQTGAVRARALGSFFHLLQDLVGEGHTATRPAGTAPPAILHYFTYGGGVNPGHGGDPGWRGAWAPAGSFAQVPRMDQVVLREIDLARLLARKTPWTMVKSFLDRFFFEFDSFDAPAVRWVPGAEAETKHNDTSHRARGG